MAGDTLAVLQAAGTAEEQALEALELGYGEFYLIGHDGDDWWAARRDGIGGRITEDTPDELRAAMAEDYALKPVKRLWCRVCGRRVTAGPRAVHAVNGLRQAADGHPAEPVDREPEHWQAARRLAKEYGGAFKLDAKWGFLSAVWAPGALGPGATAPPYEADTEDEMRRLLDQAVAGTRWERSREGARA